ncbi:MAG: DUF1684 domain-containing protein [Bacteroidota bacterium]
MGELMFTFLVLVIFTPFTYAQTYEEEVFAFQKELNEEYKNPDESPLSVKERKKFKSHDYFPIDQHYQVQVKFVRASNAVPFKMKTTTDRLPTYEKYGEAVFEISGKSYKLNIYQNHKLRTTEEYKDYLFLPFTDLTNGKETYGGGRYIELSIPSGDTIIIDFNKAYNPYCAYSYKYSCPIPPKENHLNTEILAGVKLK